MNKLEYKQIMWAEMRPYLYDGPKCDEVKPQWHTEADGDMDSEQLNVITLDSSTFPPGTKVIISVPCCPECDMEQEVCSCGFNWESWRDDQYS